MLNPFYCPNSAHQSNYLARELTIISQLTVSTRDLNTNRLNKIVQVIFQMVLFPVINLLYKFHVTRA